MSNNYQDEVELWSHLYKTGLVAQIVAQQNHQDIVSGDDILGGV